MTDLPTTYTAPDWDAAARDFLAAKRANSRRTAEDYGRVLARFYGGLEKTPDLVDRHDVSSFCYTPGPSGREATNGTISYRVAVISSFYRFLQDGGLVDHNPTDGVQRPRAEPSPPRGLDRGEIKALLGAVPDTQAGKRDRAIILTFLLTGRRRSEILNLRAGDLSRNASVFYAYRGKGGKAKRRELPEPCFLAIVDALAARGKDLAKMADDEALFNVSPHGFYLNLQRYFRNAKLPPAGVHVLRHTAAKLRRDVGESVEDVSRFLDHANLAVTTTYLRRLEGEQDTGWRKVAALLT
jgi:site-specific recombinase XerD